METRDVSIIVPVFNCKDCLRECIDSALGQSFGDFELILVDDGSTDGSSDVIDDYASADPRVRVIHQQNGGASSARNAGLDAASGRYVYFMDSDDIMEPSMLQTVIPLFEAGHDMVVFGFRIFPDGNRNNASGMDSPDSRQEYILDSEEKRFGFLCGPFRRRAIRWEVWNRVYRMDMIRRWSIRFPEDRRAYPEDMFFNLCYAAHSSRILVIPDVLYSYRDRQDSISSTVFNSSRNLMVMSSNLMAGELGRHYKRCEDCKYLSDNFNAIYYLLHKAAVRRLRRYQWQHKMNMEQAHALLRENVTDYPFFIQGMRAAYNAPAVKRSYREDKGRLLQFTDRLYMGELLGVPSTGFRSLVRRTMLHLISLSDSV